MIELEHIDKTFSARGDTHHALCDVSLRIDDGDVFGIIGQSGAGKSTLVRCINLLERPTAGRVLFDGVDVTNYQGRQLRELRENVGMIFQNFSLFQQRTVLGNVTFPLALKGRAGGSRAEQEQRARELLQVVGLAGKENRYPSELSGGQQQRAAIARALISNPSVLLCDEATSALDTRTTVSILDLLRQINQELGVTIVIITHSLAVAKNICSHIVVLDEGRVVEEGLVTDVLEHPQSDAARELIGFEGLEGRA